MSLKYTEDHEWLRIEDAIATVGITMHAQDALGDVVFVELPALGQELARQEVAGVIESVKAAADLFMPLSGEIVERNQALLDDPSLANTDPQGAGWLFKLRLSQPAELDTLLDEAAYQAIVARD